MTFPWDFARYLHLRKLAQNTQGEKRGQALKDLLRQITEHILQRHVFEPLRARLEEISALKKVEPSERAHLSS